MLRGLAVARVVYILGTTLGRTSIFGRVLGTLPRAGQGGQLRRLWKPELLPALGQPNRSGGGLYGAKPGGGARLQNTAAHLLTATRLEWAVVDNHSPGAVTSFPFPPKGRFERKDVCVS